MVLGLQQSPVEDNAQGSGCRTCWGTALIAHATSQYPEALKDGAFCSSMAESSASDLHMTYFNGQSFMGSSFSAPSLPSLLCCTPFESQKNFAKPAFRGRAPHILGSNALAPPRESCKAKLHGKSCEQQTLREGWDRPTGSVKGFGFRVKTRGCCTSRIF